MSQHPRTLVGSVYTSQSQNNGSPPTNRAAHTSSPSSPSSDRVANFESPQRSLRKGAPSPLQTGTSISAHSGHTLRTKISDEPRSPKERLDDLLASERSFYDADDMVESPTSTRDTRSEESDRPSTASRSASDPVSISKASGNAGRIPAPMAAVPEHRVAMGRGMPRTSSIDSAISSISVGTHSYKASQDSAVSEALPDIALLIQTTGSAEAVIQHLLKEKQSQSAQNAQLWRLVDKQRSMILGLNKDLERAIKDKDRYRKKLKDSLAAMGSEAGKPSDLAQSAIHSSPKSQHRDSDSHPPVGALITAGLRQEDAGDELLRPSTETRSIDSSATDSNTYNASHASNQKHTQAPRRAPPAPLKLAKNISTSAHLHEDEHPGDSGSDYDDVLEVDEIPSFGDRGRRKTREEDDRDRELAASRDAEARSSSKQSKSSKSRPAQESTMLPSQPVPQLKQAVQIRPPELHGEQLSNSESVSGSLAGILNSSQAREPGSDIVKRTLMSPPLMSPGLPASPRPSDRPMGSPLPRNPPMSARGMGSFPSAPLSPRAPRGPIPLPPNTPLALPTEASKALQHSRFREEANASPVESKASSISIREPGVIYQGLVSDEYPDLLLPPNALPSIDIRVASSRLKHSRRSMMYPSDMNDYPPIFTLAVFSRADERELWRIEKEVASLSKLDHDLKKSQLFNIRVPDKSLFTGHAPAKIDARRAALERYFDDILNTPMDTASALHICKYISTHTIEPNAKDVPPTPEELESPNKTGPGGRPLKSGYLTKRGKNFGGWKARFFVLDGPVFKYYEGPGGAHLGAIKLQHAKIAKQQQTQQENQQDDLDNQYRHAFLILEPKRRDSSSLVKHLLCAESDRERDEWVDALIQYVEFQESEDDRSLPGSQHGRTDSDTSSQKTGASSKRKIYGPGRTVNIQPVNESQDDLQALPYEATMPGQTPKSVGSSAKSSDTPSPSLHTERDGARFKDTATPSPTIQSHESEFPNKASHPQTGINISGPKNATRIEDNSTWGNKMALLPPDDDKKNQKKRSFFGFGSRPRPSSDSLDKSEISSLSQLSYEQHGPIRAVFGAPLGEAVMYNHPVDVDIELPAVVYRCVEYLDHHNAASEEGIFRLSGSNVIIKALRERFNVEGDVNLVTDDQYYDIHAVASLLKLYLRELPTTILTRELHLDFLAVTELGTLDDKIAQLCRLVHKLPRANNTLLRYLASFLINIVNHSSVNKMTVRNVGIVFSPTLNIPAPVFAMFLEHYERIFDAEPTESQEPSIDITVTGPSQNSDDIRSPRKMQFQDLPTPTYGQDSFSGGDSLSLHKAAYDTGFSPLPSTHENVPIPIRTLSGPEYGRLGKTIAGPAYGSSRSGGDSKLAAPTSGSSRQKRRESSMFGMGVMGKRDRTTNEVLVEDDAAFE